MDSPGDDKKLYAAYKKQVQRCALELPCPACEEEVSYIKPGLFKAHFETFHPDRRVCCWCGIYTWEPGERLIGHAGHLRDCFNRLFDSVKKRKQTSDGIKVNKNVSIKGPTADLSRFRNRLAAMNKTTGSSYTCPKTHCSRRVEPRAMERHFVDSHAPFDPSTACVWCDGAFVWPRGQKNRNVEHLSRCFEAYFEEAKRRDKVEARKTRLEQRQQRKAHEADDSWLDLFSNRHLQQTFTVTADDAAPRISCGCYSFVGHMLGRDRILADYAYEHLFLDADAFPLPRVTNPIEFEDTVERARYYLDLYCQWNRVREDDDGAYDSEEEDDEEEGDTVATWYHVMVSAFAFGRFVQAVREFGTDKVFALPFWCWCDGGRYRESIFRHHRHMILVVRNGCRFVERCWRKLSRVVHGKQYRKRKKGDEEPCEKRGCDMVFDDDGGDIALPEGFYMGRSKKITTWLHLVNTMRYVSVRGSGCRYDFEDHHRVTRRKGKTRKPERTDRHFCFGSDWHCLGTLCLACVASRRGLQGLLDQETRSKSVDLRCVFRWPPRKGPWHVRVGDLKPGFHAVLPVKKEWRPVKIISPEEDDERRALTTTAFLYLMDGKKLAFERDPWLESLGDCEWRRVQAKEGCCVDDDDKGKGYEAAKNLFYDVIADTRWKLSRWQQVALNLGEKHARVLNERLEKEVESLKGEIVLLRDKFGTENESLKAENESLKGEKELLRDKFGTENESLKAEVESLKGEIVLLRDKFGTEIESLKRRLWVFENPAGGSGMEERKSGAGNVIINGSVSSVYCNT